MKHQLPQSDHAVRSDDYGQAVTIEQAETRRQERFIASIKASQPDLYGRALDAVVALRLASQKMEAIKVELGRAVPPGQLGDALDMLNRDSALILNAGKDTPTLSQATQAAQTDKSTRAA